MILSKFILFIVRIESEVSSKIGEDRKRVDGMGRMEGGNGLYLVVSLDHET